jgi:hypothetical protein
LAELSDILVGVIISLLFIGVRPYILRLALSVSAPIIIYWLMTLVSSHASHQPWNYPAVFRSVVGGLLGAQLRFLWLFVKARRAD